MDYKTHRNSILGKCLLGLLIVIVFLLIVFPPNKWKFVDYARITQLDYTAEIVDNAEGDNGKVLITEQLTFDVHAQTKSDTFKELWRDLPESYVDGVKVSYKVLSVKQLNTNGMGYQEYLEAGKPYHSAPGAIVITSGYGPGTWYHSEGPYDGVDKFECVVFNVDIYREKVTFEIQYEMYNASLRYGDCSELYLSLFSGKDVKHLESVKGKILVPNDKMPDSGNYDAHSYGTNSHEFEFAESKTLISGYHAFIFSLDKSQLVFKPYNSYIEFALVSHGADKHKFTQFASKNIYYDDNDVYSWFLNEQKEYEELVLNARNNKIATVICLTVIAVVFAIIPLIVEKYCNKKYAFIKSIKNNEFYRDIPSLADETFVASFAFCKHRLSEGTKDANAAAMLGLIQKGYIESSKRSEKKDWTQENIRLTVSKDAVNAETGKLLFAEQTETEQLLFQLIRRHSVNGSISLNVLQDKVAEDYDYTRVVEESLKKITRTVGMQDGYFKTDRYKEIKKDFRGYSVVCGVLGVIALLLNLAISKTRLDFAFGALFILAAGFAVSMVLTAILSRKYVLLTQYGEEEYRKWRGLYNFLNSETLINERTIQEVAIWEEYLIYATAFGISDKVISALAIRCPEYNSNNSRIIGHPYFCSRAFVRFHTRSFMHSIKTASRQSRFGSSGYGGGGYGGGFGGGYGGGGRGGGGGGGGH